MSMISRNGDSLISSTLVAIFILAVMSTSSAGAAQPGDAGKGGIMSDELKRTASAFVNTLTKGDFQGSTAYFDATMKAGLPAQTIGLIWQQLSQNGKYERTLAPRVEPYGAHTIIFVPAVFGTTTVDFKVVFSGTDKISGFFIVPHAGEFKEAPYVKPSAFSEKKITVGTGKWQLDGHLSLPAGPGPFPAVILVHGSGPNDEDESIGPNKPFKDLSGGLATRGIAVLRYNKRTRQHASSLTKEELRTFTVREETLDDVLEAARVLRDNARIDKTRIFVIGHSLGGMLIPRIAAQDKELRGLIMLAGANSPLEDAMVTQVEYLISLDSSDAGQRCISSFDQRGKSAKVAGDEQGKGVLATEDDTSAMSEAKKKLEHFKEERSKIKALKEQDAENGPQILGGYPAYWLDLRKHDPLKEIAELDRPLIVLQGERDYQVTADGDFPRWKAAIKEAGKDKLCQFKLYPGLNHLFMSGSGKCSPQEYEIPAHVDEAVIIDISDWIKNQFGQSK